MQNVEQLSKQIINLSKKEKEALLKKLILQMDSKYVIELFKETMDKEDIAVTLKMIEPIFADWDNKEDEIYDSM